jgi:hypothetical protein
MRAWILVCLVGAGCASARIPGQPYALTFPQDANPDVIWVVRPVNTERNDSGEVTLFGLFACYRPAEPGPPQCFLAESAGNKEALVWPDDPKKYRW